MPCAERQKDGYIRQVSKQPLHRLHASKAFDHHTLVIWSSPAEALLFLVLPNPQTTTSPLNSDRSS
jgi:hypothetical protein